MVEMHVQRSERQLVVLMIRVRQALGELPRGVVVGIDQGRDAFALLTDILRSFANAGAGEIADRLGAVLIAARGDDGVELFHQRIVEGDGHSLHRRFLPALRRSRAGLSGASTSSLKTKRTDVDGRDKHRHDELRGLSDGGSRWRGKSRNKSA